MVAPRRFTAVNPRRGAGSHDALASAGTRPGALALFAYFAEKRPLCSGAGDMHAPTSDLAFTAPQVAMAAKHCGVSLLVPESIAGQQR